MANFEGTTACNGAKVKDVGAARAIVAKYHWLGGSGEETVAIADSGEVEFYGYSWPDVKKWPEGHDAGDPDPEPLYDQDDCTDDLLLELAPLLKETLVVQAIGHEKCRWPLAGVAWIVPPGAKKVHIIDLGSQVEVVEAATLMEVIMGLLSTEVEVRGKAELLAREIVAKEVLNG